MMRKATVIVTLILALVTGCWGAAPRGKSAVAVGRNLLKLEYGRPSLEGRSFEELMTNLPKDRIWRAGSDQVTTFSTTVDLLIGDKKVPAGKYSVYLHIPREGTFSLLLNSTLGQPLSRIWNAAPKHLAQELWPHFSYSEEILETETARIPMTPAELSEPVDQWTMTLSSTRLGAQLTLSWGTQSWRVDIQAAKPKEGSGH